MDNDTIMSDVPAQNPRDNGNPSLVVVWAHAPARDSDQAMEDEDKEAGRRSTIVVTSCDDAQALQDDAYSQRVAEKLLSLQSDMRHHTIDELTEKAQTVITEVKGQTLHRKYKWLTVNAKNVARMCSRYNFSEISDRLQRVYREIQTYGDAK